MSLLSRAIPKNGDRVQDAEPALVLADDSTAANLAHAPVTLARLDELAQREPDGELETSTTRTPTPARSAMAGI